jgi:hypothetical protein
MLMLRAALLCLALAPAAAQAQDARTLLARHAALEKQLADNPFGRALHVESTAVGGRQKGEIHAVIDQPYRVVAPALARPADWCDILTLQVNVKGCTPSGDTGDTLATFITRKPRDAVDSAHRIDFRFHVAAKSADYLQVALNSPSGPVGTRDYEIRLEAAPLGARRTFIRMSYAYTLGTMARLAMDAYLAGAGRDKVGFSVVERLPDGRPVYVDGLRGVVERSSMRYYLAIEATGNALAIPVDQRLDARLRHWYAGITRYPQLREQVAADEYVEMKRHEARLSTAAATSGTSAP